MRAPTLSTSPTDLSTYFTSRRPRPPGPPTARPAPARPPRSLLTGPLHLHHLDAAVVRTLDEPVFAALVDEWGYEPINRPWTTRHPLTVIDAELVDDEEEQVAAC